MVDTSWPRLTALIATTACAELTSCSLAVDADRVQCNSDLECTGSGAENTRCIGGLCQAISRPIADPEWACLENFQPPTPPPGELIPYRLRFEKATQPNVPPPNLFIRLCSNYDPTCREPMSGVPQPDKTGSVTLELEPTFRGYLEVEATGLKPTLVFLPPVVTWPPELQVFRLTQASDFLGLAQAVGVPENPELGFCVMLTNNCLDQRASGVILEMANADPGIRPYYFKGGLPDFKAVETDAQGAGGWTFVPVGQATAEARLAATGAWIGVAGFYSRPNYISYVPMGPTPRP